MVRSRSDRAANVHPGSSLRPRPSQRTVGSDEGGSALGDVPALVMFSSPDSPVCSQHLLSPAHQAGGAGPSLAAAVWSQQDPYSAAPCHNTAVLVAQHSTGLHVNLSSGLRFAADCNPPSSLSSSVPEFPL